MPHLYRHPEVYQIGGLWGPRRLGHLRWTVDTQRDLNVVRRLAEAVRDPITAPWESLLVTADPPEPVPLRLRPAGPERSTEAKARLGTPWAVDHDLVNGADEVAGTVSVGVKSASAVVELAIDDKRMLEDAAQAVLDDLAAGVQVDDVTIRSGRDVIRRALR